MNLKLVRHAESTGNIENLLQGRLDFPLSDAGRSQAELLRSKLEREGYSPTHIYSSPLTRTVETAQIASSNWDCSIEQWDELTEIEVGATSGLTGDQVEERFPEIAREFAATRNFDLISGAETYDERTIRAKSVVNRLIGEHDNADRVLAFSHGGIMSHIIAQLLGTERTWYISVQNTAIFEFTIDVDSWYLGGQSHANINLWRINRFNDSCHLEDKRT